MKEKKEYIAVLTIQKWELCNHSLEGIYSSETVLVRLCKANSHEEAIVELNRIILIGKYGKGPFIDSQTLLKAKVVVVEDWSEIDLEDLYKRFRENLLQPEHDSFERSDYREYLRLDKKYGKPKP